MTWSYVLKVVVLMFVATVCMTWLIAGGVLFLQEAMKTRHQPISIRVGVKKEQERE